MRRCASGWSNTSPGCSARAPVGAGSARDAFATTTPSSRAEPAPWWPESSLRVPFSGPKLPTSHEPQVAVNVVQVRRFAPSPMFGGELARAWPACRPRLRTHGGLPPGRPAGEGLGRNPVPAVMAGGDIHPCGWRSRHDRWAKRSVPNTRRDCWASLRLAQPTSVGSSRDIAHRNGSAGTHSPAVSGCSVAIAARTRSLSDGQDASSPIQ
jgi:hypothetical protein